MPVTLIARRPEGAAPPALGFYALQTLFGGAFHIGAIGPSFTFGKEAPAEAATGETGYMVYGAESNLLGRGFGLFIEAESGTCRMVSPLPTTGHDLDDMFRFAAGLGQHFGLEAVENEDGEALAIDTLGEFCEMMKGDNRLMVQEFAEERAGFAVSGVRYPLYLSEAFCEELRALDPAGAEEAFSAELNSRQQGDYYYMTPHFYRNTQTGRPLAIYALSEGVGSIIPKEPFIPYGPGPFGDTPVEDWQVALICTEGGEELIATIPYNSFLRGLYAEELDDLDERHWYLRPLPLLRLRQLAAGAAEG